MRKIPAWLCSFGIAGLILTGNAWAQDDPENSEAASEKQVQEENTTEEGADAPKAEEVAESEESSEEAEAKEKAAKLDAARAELAQMDAQHSYEYFIELLRACGNDPAYKEQSTHKECSVDAIWEVIDAKSKLLFINAYASLVRVDRIIETYFDPIEYKYMRNRTGSSILHEHSIHNALDLFKYMFKPEKLVFNDQTLSGVAFKSTKKSDKNPYIVTIETNLSGQEFVMVRENDNVWRTAGLYNIFQAAVQPIFDSETAMQEYAKDNLMAEIERRKEVLEYFLIQQKLRESY